MKLTKLGVIALIISMALVISISNTPVGSAVDKQENIIKVTGNASVEAIPDTAFINIGVLVEGTDLIKVQEEASTKMNAMNKVLKELKIEDKDIKTTYYNVSPKYVWNEKNLTNDIVGYTVNNQVEVKVRDTEKVGKLVDKITLAGGNTINGIRFGISDETALYNKALELALDVAEQKALSMGKKFNITKVRPVRVEETSSSAYYSLDRGSLSESRSSTPINTGEMKVTASVIVEFTY